MNSLFYLTARNTLKASSCTFLYFLDVNSKHAPTQVETVITTPNDALIGNPTMVTAIPIVDTQLITPMELALVDACSNLL